MAQIAYLGTGLLGGAFVEAALARGDQVTIWNRTAAKAEALVVHGAMVAATPAAAVAGAERVHLVLRDDAVVDAVIAALRPGLAPHAIILDHTTTQPDLTAARMTRLADEGVAYLHCPVFIGPAAARAGEGIILVSGRAGWYDRVRPALEAQARRVEYLGDVGGRAATIKLAGNAWILGIVALIADVFAIGRGGGLSPDALLPWLDSFDPKRIVMGRGTRMAAGDFAASFELAMARKDVGLMLAAAGTEPIAMLAGLAARMDQLIAAGEGARDISVIGRASAERA
jgi:3-hydroxyisobutyrate dehydrogenase-like beta-hydroxyacid dehydrogenase